jgi:hypothetical protein
LSPGGRRSAPLRRPLRVDDGIIPNPEPCSTAARRLSHVSGLWEGGADLRTKFRLIAALIAIVALAALVSAPAASANAGGKKFKTLRIIAEEKQSEFLDLGDTGPSLGDELVFSDRLFIRGRQVGESGVVCVVTQAMPPYDVLTFKCEGALSLRKGQITLQGLIEVQGEDDPGPFRVAITGGTGKFRCACGEAVVRQVTETRSVYRLRIATCKTKDKGKKKRDYDIPKKKDNGR